MKKSRKLLIMTVVVSMVLATVAYAGPGDESKPTICKSVVMQY